MIILSSIWKVSHSSCTICRTSIIFCPAYLNLRFRLRYSKFTLKLVRTPLNVYFTAFKSSFLSLYAHINSDECHAWFHLNAASPSCEGTRNKWTLQKIHIHGRIRTTNSGTSCFPACTSNPSATETVTIWY